jgi:hypothetical protein
MPCISVQEIWPQLTGSKCIILFWPMLLGRHTCTGDSITLGRNVRYHCTRSHLALTKFILSIWPMILGINLAGTLWIILLGRYSCTIDLITPGRNLMCHCILTNALRHSYLYKWFDYTWQETNVSLHSSH